MEKRLGDYQEAHGEWGQLRPERFVITAPEEIFVLVTSSIGEIVLGFTVEAEAPHALVSLLVSH